MGLYHLNCEIAQNEFLPIKVSYAGILELPLGFTESFKLLIRNDNDAPIEIQKISVLDDKNCSFETLKPIPPLSSKNYEGRIKLSKEIRVENGKSTLKVMVMFSIFGELHTETIPVLVPIKKSINDSLDNLFS